MFMRLRLRGKQPERLPEPSFGQPITDCVASAIRAEDLAADSLLTKSKPKPNPSQSKPKLNQTPSNADRLGSVGGVLVEL
jgi:hypothetical protein